MTNNLIIRKGISFLLIQTLLITGFFITTNYASGMTEEQTVTKYHLDIGVQQIWGVFTGKYDSAGNEIIDWDDNIGNGKEISVNTSVKFDRYDKISNVKVYPYSDSKFNWNNTNYTSNVTSEGYYKDNYVDFASKNITVKSYSSSRNTANFKYSAVMSSIKEYDLADKLNDDRIDQVLNLMAGPYSTNPESDVKKGFPNLYNKLNKGRNGVDPKVRAYMYFTPVIIQYDVKEMVELPDLEPESIIADFLLPASAKKGETYNLIDASRAGDKTIVKSAKLYKIYDGEKQLIDIWLGSGKRGENTGGKTLQQATIEGVIEYELVVETVTGLTDTATKSITIDDGRSISGRVNLEVDPTITHEGHPVDAYDHSTYTIKEDGESRDVSAKYAYEEGLASNRYYTQSGKLKKDGYNAKATYPKKGTYPITLEVRLKGNSDKMTDTKNVQVLKTPYIYDTLSGFQKQNRKQILTFKIATYPGQPIVNWDLSIKDLKTNEIANLDKDNLSFVGSSIKTRKTKLEIINEYWTEITLEFLTKYPDYYATGKDPRDFYYKLKVEDKKGDTDDVYKGFLVDPDIPPISFINMQTAFLRTEGTNTAKIEANDGSLSDGDQLQRTWSIVNHNPIDNKKIGEFVNATGVNGYENLAFGTNQKIGWNKEGVGKTTVKLHVKDQWIEPTLEEYIKPSDYLEAETTAQTEVINIAPKVSIEPLETLKANIAILIKANEFQASQNQVNSLQAALIEKGIDGNISLVKLADGTKEGKAFIDVSNKAGGGVNNCDSEMMYLVHGGDQNSLKLVAYDNVTAKEVWSYPIGTNNIESIYIDRNKEKYLVANQSINGTKSVIILDRNTGAYLTKMNGIFLDGEVFLSNDNKRLYCVNDTGIYKLDLKTGQYKGIVNDNTIKQPKLIDGKIGFAAKFANSQYYIGTFDMQTEQIDKNIAPVYNYSSAISQYGGGSVNILEWSNDGKILIARSTYNYGDNFGGNIWIVDTKNVTEQNIYNDNSLRDAVSAGLIIDRYGNCEYVVATVVNRADAYEYYNYATIYDLKGKVIATISKSKTSSRTHLNKGFFDEEKNTITIYQGGFYGKEAIYDLTNGKWIKDWGTSSLDLNTGEITLFDNGLFSFNNGNNDGRHDNYFYMYFQHYLTPQDAILYKSLKRNATFENDADTYMAFTGMQNTENLPLTNAFLKEEGARIIHLSVSEKLEVLADKIKEKVSEARYKLQLTGNKTNTAIVTKPINLLPNTQYNYSYDMQLLSGSAIDTFTVIRTPDGENGTKYYKEVVYQEDFSDLYGGKREKSGVGSFNFTLDKAGYVSFIMQKTYNDRQVYLDGKLIDSSDLQTDDELHFLVFVPAGKHTITTHSLSSGITYVTNIKCAEAGYITAADNTFNPGNVSIQEGAEGTVKGSFISPKEVLLYKNDTMYFATKINAYDLVNKGYMTYGSSKGYGYIANENQLNVHSDARKTNKGYITANLNVTIKAPPDKKLLIRSTSNKGIIKLNEGEQTSFNYSTKVYYGFGQGREFAVMSDIEAVEIPANNSTWYDNNAVILGNASILAAGNKISAFNHGKEFYWIDTSTINCKVYKCKIGEKKDTNTIIGFNNVGSSNNLNLLISNLKLQIINNSKNVKGVQFKEKFASKNSLDSWNVQTKGNGRAEMVQAVPAKKEDDVPLVYKKGQLVKYKIFYSDYESDPSKCGYWIYAHTPYNDGEHKEAAIIYDEDGNIKSICGEPVSASISIEEALNIAKSKGLKILNKPIERFYIDGKYTVFHWEYDDTSRGLVAGGYPLYDKVSNTAELTFYVEGGGGFVPWITGISTSPDKVKENEYFSINIGIDDAEKDILHLTTEVYKDRKHIFTHRKKNILPIDSLGQISVNGKHADGTSVVGDITYPVTNTGALPQKAQTGTYEVVCTVRDETGAGIGRYKFIVVSEGKITGEVYHTEQWDINRKKYNINRFKDEINRKIPYAEYMKLKEPRTRGTNVFWSGEKFMLNADVAGSPEKVTCSINGTNYMTNMKNSGKKNSAGETIYTGSMWDKSMINKWGRKEPIELAFTFTAYYSGGTIKKHEVRVIVDNMDDYWKLHRVF